MIKTRRLVQLFFVVLTIVGVFIVRGNAERWCPFGGIESLYPYFSQGNMVCSLGVSNLYILAAVLLMTLLLRRAFCGYVCPIGALSDWIRKGGKKLGIKQINVPPKVDRVLSKGKYVVLGLILYFTWFYTPGYAELRFRAVDPCYALISRHGEDITTWTYVAAGLLIVASLMLVIPFCRWLCPLAAVLNGFSRFGWMRIKRHDDACIHCGKCAKACPVSIPVDQVKQVTHARCFSCMDCFDACPTLQQGALTWSTPGRSRRSWPQFALIGLVVVFLTAAVTGTYLAPMPSFTHQQGTPSDQTALMQMKIQGVECRGSATQLVFFLQREDLYALPGYLKLEAWPDPSVASVKITYDPSATDEQAILQAITEPMYDPVDNRWRTPPFVIEGYDPLGLDDLDVDLD